MCKVVSVIVPAFNAEKSIRRCIDSILSNKCVFEVIIVDDGSSDDTARICSTYLKKSVVKLIKQEMKDVMEKMLEHYKE